MRKLPIQATDLQVKLLVVEWTEFLAKKRFSDALDMFQYSNRENAWTPELLKKTIAGYGTSDLDEETWAFMLQDWEVTEFEVTEFEVKTLEGRTDKEEIIHERIEVDRENLYGLDPEMYIGMVHYNDVPICGSRSDLTARFHIRKTGDGHLTLEFLDLHVM